MEEEEDKSSHTTRSRGSFVCLCLNTFFFLPNGKARHKTKTQKPNSRAARRQGYTVTFCAQKRDGVARADEADIFVFVFMLYTYMTKNSKS